MRYRAPLGTSVKWITVLAAALFLGLAWWTPVPASTGWLLLIALWAFGPSGYSIEGHELVVHHRGWAPTRVPLAGLRTIHVAPGAMSWSLRTFGNGGVFGFTGWFYNKRLGRYRAWVTDPKRTVVLEFDDRTLVVSPRRANLFAEDLRERTGAEVRWEERDES